MAYVYLIHLDVPLSPNSRSRHYIGFTKHVPSRMAKHANGTGARFMAVVRERGISWCISRIWEGDRAFERKLKRRKEGPKLCPICRGACPVLPDDLL